MFFLNYSNVENIGRVVWVSFLNYFRVISYLNTYSPIVGGNYDGNLTLRVESVNLTHKEMVQIRRIEVSLNRDVLSKTYCCFFYTYIQGIHYKWKCCLICFKHTGHLKNTLKIALRSQKIWLFDNTRFSYSFKNYWVYKLGT